ncbi:hypothetical protein CFC21_015574, partial [Triticum aestivum]
MGNTDGARKKKRKKGSDGEAAASFDRDVFPILLATVTPTTGPNQCASSSSATAARLLRRLLSRLPPMLVLSPLPGPLVALLPLLLSSSSHSVAALSCEVVG